jgi:fructose-bisphosphate aldolase class I
VTSTSTSTLETTARALVVSGKGILAADESLPTIGKRFAALDIPATEENRRAYRELLFTTPGLGEFISGVILFDETMRQTSDGVLMPEILSRQGILPGIKVDLGTMAFPGFPGEKFTQGFDGLRERLAEYRRLGARFTKWRAIFSVGADLPTKTCIETNARDLALFAALSQEAGLVPIVEPEVLMDGDHTLARCEAVTGVVLDAVFTALDDHRVILEGMLLKTGMVLPGINHAPTASLESVAAATLRTLNRFVPPAVPGIVFLSGGQAELAATERLNAICAVGPSLWTLSFSFGRALQDEAMKTWRGSPANKAPARAALLHRARCNGAATQGRYVPQMEHAATA